MTNYGGCENLIIREYMGEEAKSTSVFLRLLCRRFTVLWRAIWNEKTTSRHFEKERWSWRDFSSQI